MDASVSSGLGLYFIVMALMNVYFTYRQLAVTRRTVLGGVWLVFTLYLLGTGVEFARGNGPVLSQGFRDLMDFLMGPVTYFVLSIVGFVVVLVFRRFFVNPTVAWILLNLSLLLIGFSMTDADFRAIVAKIGRAHV